MRHLTEKDEATGEYKIPKIIYSDAYSSEMVAYADLILPDTTYLERWDCISMLDRPISDPDGPADSIRQPVVKPDRNVRGFQRGIDRSRCTVEAAGVRQRGWYAEVSRRLCRTTSSITSARRASARWPAGAAQMAKRFGKSASPIQKQLERYIDNGCFHMHHLAPEQRYYEARQQSLSGMGQGRWASSARPIPSCSNSISRRCRNSASPRAATAPSSRRTSIASASRPTSIRCRSGMRRSKARMIDERDLSRCTPSPSGRCICTIHGARRTRGCARSPPPIGSSCIANGAKALGIGDDDWVWVSAVIGRVKCQVRLMEGVNTDTVWTWNAIGKRAGAWGLDKDAPEATQGFLLNHLIAELLPPREGGYRYSNSDPVTGQAAWYDLRVKIEKAQPTKRARPGRSTNAQSPTWHSSRPISRFGTEFGRGRTMTAFRQTTQKKLGLVIDLDTCVGCQACATSCKEWNTGGYSAPLTDQNPYGADPHGAWLNRVHWLRGAAKATQPHRAFPALMPALRNAGLRHRLPNRCELQARRRRHRAGQSGHLHRLQTLLVGLRLWCARIRLRRRRDEEVHALRRPHL